MLQKLTEKVPKYFFIEINIYAHKIMLSFKIRKNEIKSIML